MSRLFSLALVVSGTFLAQYALAIPNGAIQQIKIFERTNNDEGISSTAVVTLKKENGVIVTHKLPCEVATDYRYTSRICVLNFGGENDGQIYFTLLSNGTLYSPGVVSRALGRGSIVENAQCEKQSNRSDGLAVVCNSFSERGLNQGPRISVEHPEKNIFIAEIKNGLRHHDTRVSCERNMYARKGFITCSFPVEDIENNGWYSNRVVIAEPTKATSPAYYEVNTAGYARLAGQCWWATTSEIQCSF